MGFYIEEIPTEFNGITMQEADYLADEFLKDTPCNRMWDAMRALRDFYETVTSEAVDMADRKTENSSEKPNNLSEKPTGSTISKMEQVDEPKTQTETQNSNLTFEKADERCKGCGHYKLTCDLFSEICRYEPQSGKE